MTGVDDAAEDNYNNATGTVIKCKKICGNNTREEFNNFLYKDNYAEIIACNRLFRPLPANMKNMNFSYLAALIIVTVIMATSGFEDECHCGVFRNTMAEEPIISHSPSFVMPCDKEGRESCKTMCTALVQVTENVAPVMLCEMVREAAADFKPALFFRICDDQQWEYSGLSSEEPICCLEGRPTTCQ